MKQQKYFEIIDVYFEKTVFGIFRTVFYVFPLHAFPNSSHIPSQEEIFLEESGSQDVWIYIDNFTLTAMLIFIFTQILLLSETPRCLVSNQHYRYSKKKKKGKSSLCMGLLSCDSRGYQTINPLLLLSFSFHPQRVDRFPVFLLLRERSEGNRSNERVTVLVDSYSIKLNHTDLKFRCFDNRCSSTSGPYYLIQIITSSTAESMQANIL